MIINLHALVFADSRLPYIEAFLSEFPVDNCCIVFDYYNDTPESLIYKVSKLNIDRRIIRETDIIDDSGHVFEGESFHFNSITILHNNSTTLCSTNTSYTFLDGMNACTVMNAENDDPNIATWEQFIQMFSSLISEYGVNSIDIVAPVLNTDANWKFIIQKLMNCLNVYVRAIERLEIMPHYLFSQ